ASVVYNDEKLVERVAFMHEKIGSDAILEQYIDGRELYVGVIGNHRLRVLPPLELSIGKLRSDAPRIATRRVKWDSAYQARRDVKLEPAKDLAPEVVRTLLQVTKRAYRLLGLSGYARMDFRLGADNRPYFLEANPNPDIAREAELAEAAGLDGLDYPALLDRVLRVGLATR
ncbi:MAG: D-alanine--D-alanine ligase, partial [Betaproteobacteria bacterium SG8_39]